MRVPDFAERYEEVKQQRSARNEAFDVARARTAGWSPKDVREIYLSELRSRGQPIPAEPVLNATVDNIMGKPLSAVRLKGEELIEMGKQLYRVSKTFRHATRR